MTMLSRLVRIAGFLAAASIVASSTATIAGQQRTKAGQTPWGHPDLQGIWSYGVLTPLERPAALKDKEFITAEEAAALNEEAAKLQDRPHREGDTGAYNQFWMDVRKVHQDRRTSLIVDPPDGRLPFKPEVAAARAKRAEYLRTNPADSWADRSLQERCLVYHGVPPVPSNYNNLWEIFQTRDAVVIAAENIHDVRIIPLDGRAHLDPAIRQWHGDSRGRFEGQTLVVETTNYRDRSAFPSAAATGYTSDRVRVVERFTRVDDGTIDYEYMIDDPTLFTRSWTVKMPLTKTADEMFEYACHEGNRGMQNILSGARADEGAPR
jgi:hypothetical protein